MRELLFRGKRIDNGEWVEGLYLVTKDIVSEEILHTIVRNPADSCGCEIWDFEVVDPSTVGQYTGLTDKNGKKIFEGDIVNAYNEINGCIKFGEYKYPYEVGIHLGFYVEWENQYGYSSMRKDLGYWKDKIEVIGNAIDNPELLEVRE